MTVHPHEQETLHGIKQSPSLPEGIASQRPEDKVVPLG